MTLRVPGDVWLHYRQLERLHQRRSPGTSFIQFLCASFWQTWVPTMGVSDNNNLTSPCAFCHLEGEHGGRLQILPPGSNPTWVLGRHPIMRVEGRERALLA